MHSMTPGIPANWVKELSLHGAVALDLLVRRQHLAGAGNWFTITTAEMKDDIGITHFAFRNARKKLEARGVLQERDIPLDSIKGTPRRIEYLVDLDAVRKIGAQP